MSSDLFTVLNPTLLFQTPPTFIPTSLNDYSSPTQYSQQNLMKFRVGETSHHHQNDDNNNNSHQMVDYMLNNDNLQQQTCAFYGTTASSSSFDKLSFADVMQFADFGPKLALNQGKNFELGEEEQEQEQEGGGEESGMDPVYFLKFPVLNDKSLEGQNLMMVNVEDDGKGPESDHNNNKSVEDMEKMNNNDNNHNNDNPSREVQENNNNNGSKSKRKRPRTIKTTEEVESQRMTHIAVERNRRKQMNEHLRVLRSLMPGSYVQRGDQASIIGGAIEFVRELEQLLQCLESQKRRRLLGEAHSRQVGDPSSLGIQQANQPLQPPLIFPPLPLPNDQMKLVEFETGGLREETAENKSCLADVEVKLLGFDAMIKILSRRRPGQLIKTIAALEDLQLIILHTNITTIEQTVLYSFNVKVASDSGFTAEDIASSVQQIFSFIHENTGM